MFYKEKICNNFIFSLSQGYGGNVVREAVSKKAQWYVTDFQELIDELS